MSTTEVLERVAHVALGVALLFSLALFTRCTVDPPSASAGPSDVSAAPNDAPPAVLNVSNVSLTKACDR
jgi:hypothetical protein